MKFTDIIIINMAADEELAKTTGNLIQQLLSPWVAEKAQSWAETARISRLKNEFAVLEKVKKIAEKNNVTLKNINLKTLVPLLEGIGLEEEENLRDMWANLFVNYLDSSKNLTLTVYPEILKQLSTNEATILRALNKDKWTRLQRIPFRDEPVPFTDEEVRNLTRLGLMAEDVKYEMPKENRYGIKNEIKVKNEQKYYLTDFGRDFMTACEVSNDTKVNEEQDQHQQPNQQR